MLKEPFVRNGCLAAGLSEYGIPFNRDSLPLVLRHEQPDITKRLLSVQETVCSSHTDTELQERITLHKHWNFPPLQIRREKLVHGTEGAFSRVSEVELRSIRLARKSIHRQWINQDGAPDKELEEDRQVQMKLFINELSILRRVSHRHTVKLCGSYTEKYNFVFLLSPVAERTLEQVLNEGGNGNHDWLSKSYGCLSAALSWMHSHRIKHRDIKPSNILVVGQDASARVMFCDFGSALEANVKGSLTTEGRPQLQTWRYIAPEASSNWDKRNESTDLWSLGCVFIEIDTILCEQRLRDLHEHIHGSLSPTEQMKSDGSDLCYFRHPHALYTWLGVLHATDDGPGLWTKEMVNLFTPYIHSSGIEFQAVVCVLTSCSSTSTPLAALQPKISKLEFELIIEIVLDASCADLAWNRQTSLDRVVWLPDQYQRRPDTIQSILRIPFER